MREAKVMTAAQARTRLEELCVKAERSSGEMRDKLRQWGINAREADEIMEHLRVHRYVDDERFAETYTRDKVRLSRWGRRKIEQGLYQKRVGREVISRVLGMIDEDEYTANLRALTRAKIESAPELLDSYEGRTKVYRHLLSRGYEPSLAASVLREAIRDING